MAKQETLSEALPREPSLKRFEIPTSDSTSDRQQGSSLGRPTPLVEIVPLELAMSLYPPFGALATRR
jgi:hypothetical protein